MTSIIVQEREHLLSTDAKKSYFVQYQSFIRHSDQWKDGMTDQDIPSDYLGKLLVFEMKDPNQLFSLAFVRINQKITYKKGNTVLWVQYIYPFPTSIFSIPTEKNPAPFRFRLASDNEFYLLRDSHWTLYNGYCPVTNILQKDEKCLHLTYDSQGPK